MGNKEIIKWNSTCGQDVNDKVSGVTGKDKDWKCRSSKGYIFINQLYYLNESSPIYTRENKINRRINLIKI